MNRFSLATFLLVVMSAAYAPVTLAQDDAAYLLNPGDVLQVSVWNEEELTRDVLVRPDGGISFPLAGQIGAANHTIQQVQDAIKAGLESYVPDAVVTVALMSVNGNKVYVLGKVARPGEIVVNKPLDVMQALAIAGGLTPFAAENKVRILRRGPNGQQQAIGFRYSDVKEGKDLPTNIILKSGDVVVVP